MSQNDSDTTPLARLAAEFTHDLRFDDLPEDVIEAAKDHFLDALGVGLASSSLASAPPLSAAVIRLGEGGGSTGLGLDSPLPAASAALLNGTLIHSLEFDDTHAAAVVHGSAVVASAVLSVAEREGASGRDMIRAFVGGWEVFIRLGLAAPGAFQARGYQITSVAGPFISAAISAALSGLTVEQTVAALGIAGSQSSGVFEYLSEGATVKSLHPGWAAHGGIVAAELARGGMSGPSTIFDGRFGLYRTFADDAEAPRRLRPLFADLGAKWHLPSAAFKAYPCCHYIHPFMECLDIVLKEGVTPDDIASLHCLVPVGEEMIVCEPWERKTRPASGYEGKFSLPYSLAARLLDGRVDVDTFCCEPRADLLDLCERMSWAPLEGTGFPDRFAAAIEVTTTSGGRVEAKVDDVRGGAARPLPRAEIEGKFRANAARRLTSEAVERVLREVRTLERSPDPVSLAAALRSLA
jgi:2-methylcitrate dehydratase PrpD